MCRTGGPRGGAVVASRAWRGEVDDEGRRSFAAADCGICPVNSKKSIKKLNNDTDSTGMNENFSNLSRHKACCRQPSFVSVFVV